MNELLRPATLGEILDRTASLYRSRFLVLFGIASVPSAVVLAFMACMAVLVAGIGKSTPGAGIVAGLVGGLLSLIALPLVIGTHSLTGAALCHAAGGLVHGDKISIRDAFAAAWRHGGRYVGLYLLLALIIFGVPVGGWTIFFGTVTALAVASGQGSAGLLLGGLTVLLVLGLAVYVLWMLTRLCMAFPIAVLEQTAVNTALRRAATLSRGTRWRILVLFILGMALGWVASLMVTVPLFVALALAPGLGSPEHAQAVGIVAGTGMYGAWFLVQAFTMPVYAIALVLFYYDQRVRKEGFDIEILMRQAGMPLDPPAVGQPDRTDAREIALPTVNTLIDPPMVEPATVDSGLAASPRESA